MHVAGLQLLQLTGDAHLHSYNVLCTVASDFVYGKKSPIDDSNGPHFTNENLLAVENGEKIRRKNSYDGRLGVYDEKPQYNKFMVCVCVRMSTVLAVRETNKTSLN